MGYTKNRNFYKVPNLQIFAPGAAQRQKQTERPPPEPGNILKRFYALYDVEGRYFMKKVSKLYIACITH